MLSLGPLVCCLLTRLLFCVASCLEISAIFANPRMEARARELFVTVFAELRTERASDAQVTGGFVQGERIFGGKACSKSNNQWKTLETRARIN